VKKKKDQNIGIISDPHCGHRVGLTPFKYDAEPKDPKELKWYNARRALYKQYHRMVEGHKPIDILFCLGDGIDGRGEKSGSTELLTTDRTTQCDMYADIINVWEAKHIVMVFGTAYHTGKNEDWESIVAEKVNADKIGGQEWVDVGGVIFDLKHFTGMTQVPGSTATLGREWTWNLIWNIRDEQPKVDIFLRGHVHNFSYVGNDSFLAITCPALQGLGSKFGARIPSRRIDFGTIFFTIPGKNGEKFSWDWDIVTVQEQKPKVLSF
jgi:hypothetical protein